MKKIITLFTFLSLIVATASAQGTMQGDIRFGFQASPGFSWLSSVEDNSVNNNGSNFGLKLGLLGEFYFRENYAIFGGIGFAFGQGGTLQFEERGRYWPNTDIMELNPNNPMQLDTFPSGTNLSYNIQYIEIPFGLKLKTREFGYLQYFVEIPVFSIGIRSQARGEIEANSTPNADNELVSEEVENEDYVIRDEVSLFNMSLGLGIGAEYNISSSTSLVVGLNYNRVFTDIIKDNNSFDSQVNMNNITLRVAVMF